MVLQIVSPLKTQPLRTISLLVLRFVIHVLQFLATKFINAFSDVQLTLPQVQHIRPQVRHIHLRVQLIVPHHLVSP